MIRLVWNCSTTGQTPLRPKGAAFPGKETIWSATSSPTAISLHKSGQVPLHMQKKTVTMSVQRLYVGGPVFYDGRFFVERSLTNSDKIYIMVIQAIPPLGRAVPSTSLTRLTSLRQARQPRPTLWRSHPDGFTQTHPTHPVWLEQPGRGTPRHTA